MEIGQDLKVKLLDGDYMIVVKLDKLELVQINFNTRSLVWKLYWKQ